MHVISFLDQDDLVAMIPTCKPISELVQPLIWAHIEFHGSRYHESSHEIQEPPAFFDRSTRPGHVYRRAKSTNWRAAAFFRVMESLYETDLARFKSLAAQIVSLCTVMDPYTIDAYQDSDSDSTGVKSRAEANWKLFTHMVNLEALELHVAYLKDDLEKETTEADFDHPLPKLRFVELFGHVPRYFARYAVLGSAATLERVELGLLNRPIYTCLAGDARDQMLPRDLVKAAKDSANDDNDDDDDDYGSLYEECVPPRPLGFLTKQDLPRFPKLSHLHLCKPSIGDPEECSKETSYSTRAQAASLADWVGLIRAVESTVEVLVLEHFYCLERIEGDCMSKWEYIKYNSAGPDEKGFTETILPLLREMKAPKLHKLCLYGVYTGENSSEEGEAQVISLCGQRGWECDARLGRTSWFDDDNGEAQWAKWYADSDGGDSEDDSDDGDEFTKYDDIVWKA